MSKASKTITLLLVPLSIIFLGFHDCESDEDSYATTQPSNSSSGGSSHWFYSGRSSYSGRSYSSGSHSSYSSSSHSSFSSGTSRGGFGSHAGSVGS